MTQINPNEVVKKGIIKLCKDSQINPNGIDLSLKESVMLTAGHFVNVEVQEQFDMKDSFGLIIIRSSLSRKGIFCSAGIYDSGYKSTGGLSLYNLGDKPVWIEKGSRVAQMIVFKADAAKEYDGYYNKTKSIESKGV